MSENNNEEQFETFSPEDVSVPTEIEDEFDGDKFESEYRRKIEEREASKRAEIKKLIFIIMGAALFGVLVALFCFTDTGIIGAYKRNFSKNFNYLFFQEPAIDIGATEKDSDVQKYVDEEEAKDVKNIRADIKSVNVMPFEGAASGKFEAYEGGLICARTNYICFTNALGEIQWEQNTTVVDPILSVDGRYIAIASENGTKLCLYKGEELMFECNTDNEIKSMRVSAGGDVVLVCDKENYKGAISVYNKEGKEIFAWSSGKNNVVSADISSASRRVAAALLNADRKVYSLIKIFDINSKTNNVEMAFDDTILFKLEYTGDTVTGFGDNSLVCMTSAGRVVSDKRFDMVDISHYSFDSEGNRLVHFDSAGVPVFHMYGRKGVLEKEMIVDEPADFIDIYEEMILYNDGRSINLRKMGGDRINEYTATMDVLKLVLIDKNTYAIIHSNSIEIVRV